MRVHVFNCPECREIWSLPTQYIDGTPSEECKYCGGPLRHGETEVSVGV